jgi:hypothetical protein
MVSSGYVFSVLILLTETLRDRAVASSLSIETALAFTGWGCFDYMGK